MHRFLTLLAAFVFVAAASLAGAQAFDDRSIVNDPEWRKRFLGSYGFLSGAEPDIRPEEIELLREVVETMKVNAAAAAAMLEPQVGQHSSAAVDFILANLKFQIGERDPATDHYRRAIEKFPDFRRAHKNLGLLLVQQGKYKEALVHLSRAVELGDRDGRSFGLIGYCYVNVENYLAAEQAYRNAILQEPDVRDWKLGLARSLLAMQRYREAVSLFDVLIAETPDDSAVWLLQANAYIGLEQPKAAAVNLEAVRMMGKAQGSSLVLLGDIYMKQGMPDLARDAYLEVIRSDEGSVRFDTAYRAADLLVRTRAHGEAREVLEAIQKRYGGQLGQDDELKVLTLQARLARAQGRDEQAAALLESIVARDGTRGDALLELAAHHREQGDVARAQLLIERAQRLGAWEYQALLDHAQLRVSSRDYAEAAGLLRRALQIKREPRVEQFLARVEAAVRPR